MANLPMWGPCMYCATLTAYRTDRYYICSVCDEILGPTYFVNEYLMDQAYGGPEEGGWWYSTGEYRATHHITYLFHEAHRIRDELAQGMMVEFNEGRPEISSVLSIGLHVVIVQTHEGKSFPEHKPHYE